MARYVALLRGINVGGNNLIKMTALAQCFAAQGFRDVSTYIQSGNVIFDADEDRAALTRRIEEALSATFRYRATVVVRSRKQMKDVVERAPVGFGREPARYRYDVIFVKEPLTAAAALEGIPRKEGIDQLYAGPGVIYASRLISKATQSRLNKIAAMPIYQSVTIRNWNTTTKLVELMDTKAESRAR